MPVFLISIHYFSLAALVVRVVLRTVFLTAVLALVFVVALVLALLAGLAVLPVAPSSVASSVSSLAAALPGRALRSSNSKLVLPSLPRTKNALKRPSCARRNEAG